MMAVIALVVSVALFVIVYRLKKRQLHDLMRYEHHVNIFHESMKPVVEDDETPVEILGLVRFLNNEIIDKDAAPILLKHVSGGRFNAFTGNTIPLQKMKPIREFFARRPELEIPFNKGVASAMIAISYNHLMCGEKIRFWLSTIDTAERHEQVAAQFNDLVDQSHVQGNRAVQQAAAA